MNTLLPKTPQPLTKLCQLAIHHCFRTLKKVFLLILLLVILKDASIYFGGMPKNPYTYFFITLFIGISALYILITLLYISHKTLNKEKSSWGSILQHTLSKIGYITLLTILFILFPIISLKIAQWLVHHRMLQYHNLPQYLGFIVILLIGLPTMFLYLYYLLTVPLIVNDNHTLWKALKRSPHLIGYNRPNLIRVFSVYTWGMVIWLLVSPNTLHGHLIKTYKVSVPFDYIVLSVTLPILMNLVVLIYNDLKLREQADAADS